MKTVCPKCKISYNIDDSKIPDAGINAFCKRCQTRFFIKKKVPAKNGTLSVCSKCGSERNDNDTACRKCGMVYHKYEGMLNSKKPEPKPVEPSVTPVKQPQQPHNQSGANFNVDFISSIFIIAGCIIVPILLNKLTWLPGYSVVYAFIKILLFIALYLSAPALIRYAILKKPVKTKLTALVIIFVNFLILLTVLAGHFNLARLQGLQFLCFQINQPFQPGPYAFISGSPLLYVCMFIAYFILRAGHTKTNEDKDNVQQKDSDLPLENETINCPFCAETIKVEAIKCRYCGEFLKRPQKLTFSKNYITAIAVGIIALFIYLYLYGRNPIDAGATLASSGTTWGIGSIAVRYLPSAAIKIPAGIGVSTVASFVGTYRICRNNFIRKFLEAKNNELHSLGKKTLTVDEEIAWNKYIDNAATVYALINIFPETALNIDYTEMRQINNIGMTFVYIGPGTFMMGSPENELGKRENETQHQVTLTRGFYMQTTEVTQGQWKAVMGSNPSYFKNCGADCPVEQVSWNDVQNFITKMNERGEGTYRLPTEAEWEYAARAGSTTAFHNGGITNLLCDPLDSNLDQIAWYCGNSKGKTHPVAQKQPNAWGLYDMSGNVWERCQDWYGSYPTTAVTDPIGPSTASYRVVRGGGWGFIARYCRSADRYYDYTSSRDSYVGFRLTLSQVSNPGK